MATSKTIAALLGPTLVASAVSLLANLATSQALFDELSQSPALIMIGAVLAEEPGPPRRSGVIFAKHIFSFSNATAVARRCDSCILIVGLPMLRV
jgi:hypothetical protein